MYTGPNILVIKYFLWKINTEISDLKSALITVSFKRNGVIHEKQKPSNSSSSYFTGYNLHNLCYRNTSR